MDNDLQQRVTAIVHAYVAEAQWWQDVPGPCRASRHRLQRFIELDAPDLIIEREVVILQRKITSMQRHRLDAMSGQCPQ